MARKTVDIKTVIDYVNSILLYSQDDMIEMRQGAINLAEALLHKTDNYKGYGYLSLRDMEESVMGTTVGIRTALDGTCIDPDTSEVMRPADRFNNTDDTRRQYIG